ncbi:hypothetical protein GOP47_0028534 [Adiantum capillus-veneris]|nr:hypothetical protein GOP47_0028534 [Adiantum capillus-veneris]
METKVSSSSKGSAMTMTKGRHVMVLANLKPRNMRGVKSNGMLLAASDESHENVELLVPSEGSVTGDRAWFGAEADKQSQKDAATPNQLQKKKVWEGIQPKLKTSDIFVAEPGEFAVHLNLLIKILLYQQVTVGIAILFVAAAVKLADLESETMRLDIMAPQSDLNDSQRILRLDIIASQIDPNASQRTTRLDIMAAQSDPNQATSVRAEYAGRSSSSPRQHAEHAACVGQPVPIK